MFLYSCVLFPVVTLASGLAPSYLMYVFTRFLVGAAYAGTLTYYVLNSEIVGTEYRSRIVVLGSASFPAGYLMLAVCAYYITGWRHLTVFSALSLATSLIGWRYMHVGVATTNFAPTCLGVLGSFLSLLTGC